MASNQDFRFDPVAFAAFYQELMDVWQELEKLRISVSQEQLQLCYACNIEGVAQALSVAQKRVGNSQSETVGGEVAALQQKVNAFLAAGYNAFTDYLKTDEVSADVFRNLA